MVSTGFLLLLLLLLLFLVSFLSSFRLPSTFVLDFFLVVVVVVERNIGHKSTLRRGNSFRQSSGSFFPFFLSFFLVLLSFLLGVFLFSFFSIECSLFFRRRRRRRRRRLGVCLGVCSYTEKTR